MRSYLDFEKPVAEIEAKLEELRALDAGDSAAAIGEEVSRLEVKAAQTLRDLYSGLTPWQKTQVARHPDRPHCLDYVAALITEFTPLAGDRYFGEDEAIVGGLGRFEGESVCVIGQEKGDDTASRVKHNFGMARPEGYRKATRLMQLADRFGLPVISLIDTAGRLPGHRGRGARPGRSHRALDRHLSLDRRAQRRRGDRRGRLRRRARDRRLQPGAHARTRHLYRGLARSGRLDPLARFLARAGSGDGHEDHRPGPDQVRHHRRRSFPSRSAARTAIRRRRSPPPTAPFWAPSRSCGSSTGTPFGASAGTSSWPWAARSDEASRNSRSRNSTLRCPDISQVVA